MSMMNDKITTPTNEGKEQKTLIISVPLLSNLKQLRQELLNMYYARDAVGLNQFLDRLKEV